MMMLCIYFVSLLTEAKFCISLRDPADWSSFNPVFQFFYMSANDMLIAVNVVLIFQNVRQKNHLSSRVLLLVYSTIQISDIAIGIPLSILYDDFWNVGYLYFLLKAGTAIIYCSRYLLLKTENAFMLKNEGSGDGHAKPEH
jgi:hypothetical protein